MNSSVIGKKYKKIERINILGVGVDDISLVDAIDAILKLSKAPNRGKYVVTVNPEFVMLAHRNAKFAQILAKSDLATADGVGVASARLIMGGKEHDRITGVDLIENLCKMASDKPIRIGYLGGFGGVAGEVAKRQTQKYPGLKVVYAKPGEPTMSHDLKLKSEFDSVGRVDVLFVAYGMGKQEFWIDRMKDKLDIGLYIGVGGAFDYLAGKKFRAPLFLQKIGFEWFWRLMLDPARIWRMRVLPVFAILVFVDFVKNKFSEN